MSKLKGKWLGAIKQQEIPAGTVNGVNVTFTLSSIPNDPSSLELTMDCRRLYVGTDFTISGLTITMAVAPAFGQQLDATYFKKT